MESAAWLSWLEELNSFAFVGQMRAYTARKETRQRGEGYWYAYRKREGKLTKKYLGKATELMLERLEHVAQFLSADHAALTLEPEALQTLDSSIGVSAFTLLHTPQPAEFQTVLTGFHTIRTSARLD